MPVNNNALPAKENPQELLAEPSESLNGLLAEWEDPEQFQAQKLSSSKRRWRVEYFTKNKKKYWQLRSRDKERKTVYIGKWEKVQEIYPTEASKYSPKKTKK